MEATEQQGWDRSSPLSLGSFCQALNPSFCGEAATGQEEFSLATVLWLSLPSTAFLSVPFGLRK